MLPHHLPHVPPGLLPGSGGLLPVAGLPFILSPRFHCYQPLSGAIPPWPGRAGSRAVTLLSLLSILFLLQRQKQKQPVHRSAVSLGSLTLVSHSHFFTGSSLAPQLVLRILWPRGLEAHDCHFLCREASPRRPKSVPSAKPPAPSYPCRHQPCPERSSGCLHQGWGGQCSGLAH